MLTAGRLTDPTSHLRLRFGTHRVRLALSVALLYVGGILLQLTSAYTLLIGMLGLAASIAGWCLVPSPGWRRSLAVAPAILGVVGLIGGAAIGALLSLTLAGWLFVRLRPVVSYIVLVIPIIASIALAQLFPDYGSGVIVATLIGAVVAVSAWLGWCIALAYETRRATGSSARNGRAAMKRRKLSS